MFLRFDVFALSVIRTFPRVRTQESAWLLSLSVGFFLCTACFIYPAFR